MLVRRCNYISLNLFQASSWNVGLFFALLTSSKAHPIHHSFEFKTDWILCANFEDHSDIKTIRGQHYVNVVTSVTLSSAALVFALFGINSILEIATAEATVAMNDHAIAATATYTLYWRWYPCEETLSTAYVIVPDRETKPRRKDRIRQSDIDWDERMVSAITRCCIMRWLATAKYTRILFSTAKCNRLNSCSLNR